MFYMHISLSFICLLSIGIEKLQNFVFIKKIKNVLMFIVYMQGELNISSTYRFMLSVSYIEELDNSSLCDTRV